MPPNIHTQLKNVMNRFFSEYVFRHILVVLYDPGFHLSQHSRAPHNKMPCFRHYFSQVLFGDRKSTKERTHCKNVFLC